MTSLPMQKLYLQISLVSWEKWILKKFLTSIMRLQVFIYGEIAKMVLNQCDSHNSDDEDDDGNTEAKVPIDNMVKMLMGLLKD